MYQHAGGTITKAFHRPPAHNSAIMEGQEVIIDRFSKLLNKISAVVACGSISELGA